jgi:hypothetical protein
MYRTTSVLALGLFIGLAPIGVHAQTQSTDTDTQLQTTQPADTQTQTETLQTDDQQSTGTQVDIPREDDTDVATDTEVDITTDDDTEVATETEVDITTEDDAEVAADDGMAADDEADVATTDTTEPVPDVIPTQETSDMLGSSLMGASVNLADEEIGSVSDLIITDEYAIRGVVVGVGGFLGIGEKRVALPVERLTIRTTEPGQVEISTDMTREELEQKEAFKTAAQVRSEEEAAQAQRDAEMQQPVAPTVPAE